MRKNPILTKINKNEMHNHKHSHLFKNFVQDNDIMDKIDYAEVTEHDNGSVSVRVIFKQEKKQKPSVSIKETQFDKNSDATKV